MKNLLALDIANKTGFCTRTASGVWDLTPKRDESKGMRLIRFRSKIVEVCRIEGIDIVVYERVAGRFQSATNVASELVGVLKVHCEINNIEYRAYSAKEIKLFATGKGSANKTKMVESAKSIYNIEIIDDNHADSVHLYHLAKKDLEL